MSQALILCAGSSSRMGQPKALCQLAGQTILGRIVATLAEVGIQSPQVIVAAPHGTTIAAWLQAQSLSSVQLRWNLHPEDGMLSSIQCGLAQLSPSLSGTLLWPVDVPLVKAQTVQRLLDAAPERLVVPTCGDRGGHPVWLPQARFAEVLALPRPSSLRALRQSHLPLRVAVDDPEIMLDLDTPDDLAQAEQRLRR